MEGTKLQALIALHNAINSPTKNGRQWVTYSKESIMAALDVLGQIIEQEGGIKAEKTRQSGERTCH